MSMRILSVFLGSVLTALQVANAGTIDEIINSRYAKLSSFYEDLHRHPELSLKEKRTAKKVASEFKRLGLETIDNIGGGVVGIFRNGEGPVTMVRSELDALPVNEDTNLPYKSEEPGVAHACAHDLHTAALIGAAEVMIKEKAKWRGTLIFLGQPAEEVLKGAQAMIDAGLFNKIPKPDQVIALHTRGAIPSGKVSFVPGAAQASANSIDVIFRGVSTHGSAPHRGVDPVIIASEFVLKMQSLVGRENDPLDPAVITVGSIHGGTKHNIVAEDVKLQMTMRTYNMETRAKFLERINELAKGLAKNAHAPEPTVTVVESGPVLVNDQHLTERFKKAVSDEIGADNVVESRRVMSTDDFAVFREKLGIPSMKYSIGAGAASGPVIDNHSPKFAPNAKVVLPLAIKSMSAGLLDLHRSAKELNPRADTAEGKKKLAKDPSGDAVPSGQQ